MGGTAWRTRWPSIIYPYHKLYKRLQFCQQIRAYRVSSLVPQTSMLLPYQWHSYEEIGGIYDRVTSDQQLSPLHPTSKPPHPIPHSTHHSTTPSRVAHTFPSPNLQSNPTPPPPQPPTTPLRHSSTHVSPASGFRPPPTTSSSHTFQHTPFFMCIDISLPQLTPSRTGDSQTSRLSFSL